MLIVWLRYTILITSATAIGPLCTSFILQYSSGGWVDYMWVCAGLAGVNIVAIYALYPESNFTRPDSTVHQISLVGTTINESDAEKSGIVQTETASWHHVKVVRKPWTSIWTSFVLVDHDAHLFEVFVRPLFMLLHPSVLFAIFLYGTSLASQIILM